MWFRSQFAKENRSTNVNAELQPAGKNVYASFSSFSMCSVSVCDEYSVRRTVFFLNNIKRGKTGPTGLMALENNADETEFHGLCFYDKFIQ